MTIRGFLSFFFAKFILFKNSSWINHPIKNQQKIMLQLINKSKKTVFGKAHSFSEIQNYTDFKKHVPIRDYEGLRSYIEQIINGKEDVLWPGRPLYFCKTSGTTSGIKHIPITPKSMPNHITAARDAILAYIAETKNASIVNGKMIFLQGSPELIKTNGILTGRLSGIVAHHVPSYLTKNRLPSFETNCISDWEDQVDY